MPAVSVASLIDTLRALSLLPAEEVEALSRQQDRFPSPRAMTDELVQRGALTTYQANQLLEDKGADLMLGAFCLLEPIGSGGMGQVFKAWQQRLSRMVAIKVIRREC